MEESAIPENKPFNNLETILKPTSGLFKHFTLKIKSYSLPTYLCNKIDFKNMDCNKREERF